MASDPKHDNRIHAERSAQVRAARGIRRARQRQEHRRVRRRYARRADADPEGFWGECAKNLDWFKPFGKVLDWKFPFAKWFVGGKINAAYNCLDRHLAGPRRNKAAIIWEGEPGDSRVLTYQMLADEVARAANALKELGVKDGDRVAIYMPLVPEAAIAMLACARIGAIHSVVFGGFSAEALADRINDAEAKVCITADGGWRRGAHVELKRNVDEALQQAPSIEKVIVLQPHRRSSRRCSRGATSGGTRSFRARATTVAPAEPLDSEHPLFTLYTSGTTGKPKGVVHTTGGYLTHALMTMKWVFDLKDDDIYWCTADIGWVTGHSYTVYGPLAAGATVVMYEGAPNYPENDRFWQIIEKYRVTIFYTAPTAIRTFIKWGDSWVKKHDLSSLRLLGTVGEPINPEAWMWYRKVIGGERCPIVDTWWQTETGGIMISPDSRRDRDQARLGDAPAAGNRGRRRRRATANRCEPIRAASWSSSGRGPGCCARFSAIPSATRASISARSTDAISPATARAATRTATSGSWGASMTSSTSRAIASARWRSKARWSRTRRSPRPHVSGVPTI